MTTAAKRQPRSQTLAEKRRDANAQASRKLNNQVRDIAPIPKERHKRTATACRKDFRRFCLEFFPHLFPLPFSPDHLKVIHRIEQAVLHGGLFALAMPRGSGKTTLCEVAALWALVYGHRQYVVILGSNEPVAGQMLDNCKVELETNDRLHDAFPKVCYPIRQLEGISNRCRGQLLSGERTHIIWSSRSIVLPTVPGSVASGAVLQCGGLTGSIRGMKASLPTGGSIRPDLVIIDDPQTDESAASPTQTDSRLALLNGAVLNLAGPGKKISGILPCTIIRPGDLADQLLDRAKHPQWQGEKCKLVYQWPTNDNLWKEYATIRHDELEAGGDGSQATAFYKQHRTQMDEGAEVAWPERFNEDEQSAIQHAWNLRLRDESSFFAEYQNEPQPVDGVSGAVLHSAEIAERCGGYQRAVVPANCHHLTAFIDVHQRILFWSVVAWSQDFTGYLVDYGTYPKQRARRFDAGAVKHTLQLETPSAGVEGALFQGLKRLADQLTGQGWRTDDGKELRIDRLLVDAGWQTELIYEFCRQAPAAVLPSQGRGIGAVNKPMSEYKRTAGCRTGDHWRYEFVGGRRVRRVLFDSNYWKTFLVARLNTVQGDPGSLVLYQASPKDHAHLADHLCAERPVAVTANGRTVEEWRARPGNPDNHWLDCLVGCCVAGSLCGAKLTVSQRAGKRPAKRATKARKARVSYL